MLVRRACGAVHTLGQEKASATAARRSAAGSAAPIRPRLGQRGLSFQAVLVGPGTRSGRWRPVPARGILLPPPRRPPALCFGAVARPSRHKRPRIAALANQCPRHALAFPPLRPSPLSAPRPAPCFHARPAALRVLGWSLSWWNPPGAVWTGPGEEPRRSGRWLVRWGGPGKDRDPRCSTGLRLKLPAEGSLQLGP